MDPVAGARGSVSALCYPSLTPSRERQRPGPTCFSSLIGREFDGEERIAEAVRAARGGDDLAFAELVRAYQDVAVAYAASILGDYHLAEDAAQEAFVEAHRELGALREAEAFAGWLRRIVFKHCDRLTRRKRAPVTGVEAAQVAAREPSAQEMLEARDVGSAVRDAVARLPEGEREVVLLYYIGGAFASGDRGIFGCDGERG